MRIGHKLQACASGGSTTLEQELEYAREDLKAAGVPESDIEKAIDEAKKYFNGCQKLI